MMKIKNITLIVLAFILFSCAKNYDYKDGYTFIKNAEKAVEQNEIALAEAYLVKASKSDYGFCGNSWLDAKSDINLVKAQILNKKGNYDEALLLLESGNGNTIGTRCNKRDSLKIETLFLKHGKDKVIESFQSLTAIKKLDNNGFESYSVYVKKLDYTFSFGEGFPIITYDKNGVPVFQEPVDDTFISIAKVYGLYALIEP